MSYLWIQTDSIQEKMAVKMRTAIEEMTGLKRCFGSHLVLILDSD
jgi:hypothetical protein